MYSTLDGFNKKDPIQIEIEKWKKGLGEKLFK